MYDPQEVVDKLIHDVNKYDLDKLIAEIMHGMEDRKGTLVALDTTKDSLEVMPSLLSSQIEGLKQSLVGEQLINEELKRRRAHILETKAKELDALTTKSEDLDINVNSINKQIREVEQLIEAKTNEKKELAEARASNEHIYRLFHALLRAMPVDINKLAAKAQSSEEAWELIEMVVNNLNERYVPLSEKYPQLKVPKK